MVTSGGFASAAELATAAAAVDELPSGVVTLLFTDIEGSTQLLKRAGDRYAGILERHHELIRAARRGSWRPRCVRTGGPVAGRSWQARVGKARSSEIGCSRLPTVDQRAS